MGLVAGSIRIRRGSLQFTVYYLINPETSYNWIKGEVRKARKGTMEGKGKGTGKDPMTWPQRWA